MTSYGRWIKWALHGADMFSTCGKRQHMALIVSADNRLISAGYNGPPKGIRHCVDGGCERLYDNSPPGSDYSNCRAVHAEVNALMNCPDRDLLDGAGMFLTGEPCWDCAKILANTNLKTLVYYSDEDYSYENWDKSRNLMEDSGIELFCMNKRLLETT